MSNSNNKKKEQLGVAQGTARNKLIKKLMFSMAQELGKTSCYRCQKEIENIDNFSVEHKTPWLDSEDPKGLYFDLDNIAFSHLKCNVRASRATNRKEVTEGKLTCTSCNKEKELSFFDKAYNTNTGYRGKCKDCRRVYDKNWKKRKRSNN
ncbi:MAG: HNH endonuclease [Candidatus Riesia sp.]|nr:HNH endonuclease [Candidatus Riesia sp.]